MNRNARWIRCGRKQACPICGKKDWCCYLDTGEVFWCMRISSGEVPGFKRGRTHETAGGTSWWPMIEPPVVAVLEPRPDTRPSKIAWEEIHEECRSALTDDQLSEAISSIGVGIDTLDAFGIGWSRHWRAWTFPMRDPVTEKIVGIRTRTKDGRKFALTGSRQGYFLPTKMKRDRLVYVVEGPTDAAAMRSLGLEVVGRASCLHQSRELRERFRGRRVVVIADNDAVGIAGANKLATYLEGFSAAWVIRPPDGVKDAREWITAGGKRGDIESIAWEAIHGLGQGQQIQRSAGE
jgi:5S rRNA maturation endonuclease (ribonuclease M5)